MINKSYYQQLKPIVNKEVKNYKEDFTKFDREVLFNYTGSFLYAVRDCGTDIVLLNKEFNHNQIEFNKIWLTTYNKKFFLGCDNEIIQIHKTEVLKILDSKGNFDKSEFIRNKTTGRTTPEEAKTLLFNATKKGGC